MRREETVLLYHEELDEKIISKVCCILPNPVSFHTYIYNDKSEWVIGIAIEAETNNPLFLVCLKDGARVYEELLNEGDRSGKENKRSSTP